MGGTVGNSGSVWIERIVEETGWLGLPDETGWAEVEARIGVRLPSDFKELTRRFGNGSYYGRLDLFHQESDKPWVGLVDGLRAMQMWAAEGEDHAAMYGPYRIFGVGEDLGLLQWASDSEGGEYHWLADASADPDRWPVVARIDGESRWHRFEMSTTEFIYRWIADPDFKPFTLAKPGRRAFFLPADSDVDVVEHWAILTDPNRDH